MKRRTTGLLAAALLAVLLLAGCGTRPLPSGMEEEAVGQAGDCGDAGRTGLSRSG